ARQFLCDASRQQGLRKRPMGTADFQAAVRRKTGQRYIEKHYTVQFRDCAAKYDQFPYPLEGVSGTLYLHPDRWEARNFTGHHSGGEVSVDVFATPLSGRLDGGGKLRQQIRLVAGGRNIKLDSELHDALAPPNGERDHLKKVWKTLAPAGRIDFQATVIDRPGQPQDVDVNLVARDCSARPTFFDYAMTN